MTPATDSRTAEALAGKVFEALLGTFDVYAIYLGGRLGYYEALDAEGPADSKELARRTNTDERYTREWLEQQYVTGVLDRSADGRFALPAPYRDVLLDRDSLSYSAPFLRQAVAAGAVLPQLLKAYRTGEGIDWADYGADMVEAQAEANRPMNLHQLGQELLPQVPGLAECLGQPGARVADIGCGHGWSSIGIANSFPAASVDGFDLDCDSIKCATANAADMGLGDRVRFHAIDAASAPAGSYDLAIACECVHDMSDPVAVLRAMRGLLASGGTCVVMDERVADELGPDAGPVERLFYGYSITTCLPNGRIDSPSAATGTVMRRPTLERYALEAGFRGVEALAIEHEMFAFYRLR